MSLRDMNMTEATHD